MARKIIQTASKIAFLYALSFGCAYSYDSIDEALKNGVSKGDVIFYGDYQGLAKGQATSIGKNLATYSYLGNTGYLLGSVGLSYTSGFYKNIRAAVGFRAATPFYNAHKNLRIPSVPNIRNGGVGDATKDFFNHNQAALAESFFEYFDGDTNIKAGRFIIPNEWINTMSDGIWIRNRSIENLMFEGFWVNDVGRIAYYQMSGFDKINPYSNFGLLNLAIKYYIAETFTIKAYTFFTPKIFTAFGAKIDGKLNISSFFIGANVGYAYSIEGNERYSGYAHNGAVLDAKAFFGMKFFEIAAGYIHTSKDSGWGNIGIMGDSIDPFFVWGGKAIKTQKNGNLIYASISANVERFKFSLTYGSTSYGQSLRQNEINFSTEIGFTHNVWGILNILNTHKDAINIPTTTQINGGIRLSF
ncbi:Opr family porin [Helicobacter sp. 11S02596-1]|uniref:Opr family porin n=1 Tax=Helicobacter sp. 11S02596-1 TaxID=1476194 RepID=UPI00117A965D|nr:Opr family porin [Helicobacter sp. 11S02596-1]